MLFLGPEWSEARSWAGCGPGHGLGCGLWIGRLGVECCGAMTLNCGGWSCDRLWMIWPDGTLGRSLWIGDGTDFVHSIPLALVIRFIRHVLLKLCLALVNVVVCSHHSAAGSLKVKSEGQGALLVCGGAARTNRD